MPTLRGRWFNVAICCECWDRLNPDRKMEPGRKQATELAIIADWAQLNTDERKELLVANRCAACEEVPHAGIFIRVTVEKLRAMRPHV